MKNIRLVLILIIGGILTYFVYQSQFHTFFFEDIFKPFFFVVATLILVWTTLTDFKIYKVKKATQNFTLTLLCLIYISIILILYIKNQSAFNKETLLRVFYDGDFNGTGIDFKTDGMYIFDSSAIGVSNYYYGTYKILGNKITMDKDQLENLENLKYLEIKAKEKEQTDLYLYQIDSIGNLIPKSTKFRVIIDNRK